MKEIKVIFSSKVEKKLKEVEFPESVIKNIAQQISKYY